MSERCPFGEGLQRYWDRLSPREREMSLDEEALYSLAPQEVGLEIAAEIPGRSVIDAFCGAGGLAIALARKGKRVIAIDLDPARLEMARRNADLFGIEKQIEFVAGDASSRLPTMSADAVLLDPPWGGPDYWKA